MTDSSLIPPSPAEDEYVSAVKSAEPPPLLDDRDPFALFEGWLKEALKSEVNDANAMNLATVDADGMPNCRMVLLKGVDPAGFVFYTNTRSAKGRELAGNPKAALTFHWKSLRRSVRVRGDVEGVTDAEADAYFATRARPAQIGAWASRQSQHLDARDDLEARVAEIERRYEGQPVPRPPHWGGFRVVPRLIEFWHDRQFRLHDRIVYTRPAPDAAWRYERLNP